MQTPCIVIARPQAGSYRWCIFIEQEPLETEEAETSIAACLTGAYAALPGDIRRVRIRYRGLEMSSVDVLELEHCADDLAEKIAAVYSASGPQKEVAAR